MDNIRVAIERGGCLIAPAVRAAEHFRGADLHQDPHSTFSLYESDAFEAALGTFRAVVERRFADPVEWHDENDFIHAVRGDS